MAIARPADGRGVAEGKAVDEGWESRSVAPPGGGSRYLERLRGSPVCPATLSPTRTFEGDASVFRVTYASYRYARCRVTITLVITTVS